MINFDTLAWDNDIGAAALQDVYALTVFGKDHKGTYVDIGCRHPVLHNNTFLLEKYGWTGFAVDLTDYTNDWKNYRPNSVYHNGDAFGIDYKNQFNTMNLGSPIDFLSIDLEGMVDRCNILKQIFESGYEFKTITIEHDAYCTGESEKTPQREFLTEQGYTLVRKCEYIEDFWINPKYIWSNQYKVLIQDNCGAEEVHTKQFLKAANYNWTHFYDVKGFSIPEFLQ